MGNNPAVTPEPAPERTDSAAVWPLVIRDVEERLTPAPLEDTPPWLRQCLAQDMRARDAAGREKYGVPLQVHNGRRAIVDAYQEALDLCVYLRQQAERTDAIFWHRMAANAIGTAAAIRYQLALEEQGEG